MLTTLTTATLAETTRNAVAAEVAKIELPEGVVVSDELKMQFAGAGVRATIDTLASTEGTLVIELVAEDFFNAYFDDVNN